MLNCPKRKLELIEPGMHPTYEDGQGGGIWLNNRILTVSGLSVSDQ